MLKTHVEKVVIIGSGPAGLTAAIYAARANLNPLLFEGNLPNIPGGQLMLTSNIENFPGFPEGIAGDKLIKLLKQQALNFGTKFKLNNVYNVDFNSYPFKIFYGSNINDYVKTYTIIIATGSNAKLLGLKNELQLIKEGGGVSTCATCDGPLYRNVNVAVVGGGDSAMEEAMFLSKFASKVILIHRRKIFKASKIMLNRAMNNSKIIFNLDVVIHKILTKVDVTGKHYINALLLKNVCNNEIKQLYVDGLFIAIGHNPNTKIFIDALKLDDSRYLLVDRVNLKTNINGIFACGDVVDNMYKQAITASASGCKAAMSVESYLMHKKLL